MEDRVTLPDPEEERALIRQAVELAGTCDLVVLAVGGNEQTSREAWNIYHLGDRSGLGLFGMQDELVHALHATGKPLVTLLFNGRPLAIGDLAGRSAALFECWYLGQESGRAVASVLFGDFNPGAKLPISFPRSAGHLPVFYNHKPSARRGYVDGDVSPLYPFGYGLSYTSFELKNLRLDSPVIGPGQEATLSVDVTNTGKRKGDEVVQLYIRDEVSSATRPVKELKGFRRITLEPGETAVVSFRITPGHLSFYDASMNLVVEPGDFTLMVGNSSADGDLQKLNLEVRK